MRRNKQETEIQALSEILRIMRENGFEDKDDFASRLAELFVDSISLPDRQTVFLKRATKVTTNFFKANKAKKIDFLNLVFTKLSKKSIRPPSDTAINPPLFFAGIFPEIKKIKQVSDVEQKLKIKEDVIQNALRDALRDKGASPITQRGKDSSIEVADLEHFSMKIKDTVYSFAVVVKGYNSISGKRVSWEDVSHQIMKANRTNPNYILFLTAKEPKDSVISEMQTYGNQVNKPNLVVFVTPLEIAKLLVWRRILEP